MTKDAAAIGREFFNAFNDREVERGMAIAADESEIVEVATGERFQGPDGYRHEYEKWSTAFPDGRCEPRNTVTSGDWAVLEMTFRGTNTGGFAGPEGELPPTGREVAFDFCTIVQVRDGKLVAARHYHDNATVMQQLGLMPEAAAAPA
jgi:predicted ester cyclase